MAYVTNDVIKQMKQLRQGKGFSQKAFAANIGYSQSYVSEIEHSKKDGSREFWEAVERVLGVKLRFVEGS